MDGHRRTAATQPGPADLRPGRRLPWHLTPEGEPPIAGPLDELSRARLTRQLRGYLDDTPVLDAHVALLDTRGAWYAAKALGAWAPEHPDSFFGLVRHVVRTQAPGPPPQPDVEGWLAAGRPEGPLGEIWDGMRGLRHQQSRRPAVTGRQQLTPAIEHLDEVLLAWPHQHLERFTRAYAALELVLERRHLALPPIDA